MLSTLAHSTLGQNVGTLKTENQPQLSFSTCTKAGGCQSSQKSVTIDANWRWTHKLGEATNCYTGNEWDDSLCPDPQTCAQNCVIEGADAEYEGTYGVKASGNQLQLDFVTQGPYSSNVGSRTYLMDTEDKYYMFKLKNKEFTFDVDVSALGCGLNGALYFVQMDEDGGKSKYPLNKAGAKYGTGYCDAQCPHDLKFINGEPNILDWTPSATDPNAGTGKYGTCCVEMDIWEANSISSAYTTHSCAATKQTRCEGKDCGDNPDHRFDGLCDKNGCDIQPFRMGNSTWYGPGSNFAVDTTQKVTVVTQFLTTDGTDSGTLNEIRRFYVQNGKQISSPTVTPAAGGPGFDSLSDDYCKAEVGAFKDNTNFLEKGGFGSMDNAMEAGMVLVMSLWDDHYVNMLWLDSTYPVDTPDTPGAKRGTCATTSGVPKDIEKSAASSNVKFSNIKLGELGSTTSTTARPGLARAKPTSLASAKATPQAWEACSAAQPCPAGFECTAHGEAQACLPTAALLEAFVHTQPSQQDVADFLSKGTTRFPSAGLKAF